MNPVTFKLEDVSGTIAAAIDSLSVPVAKAAKLTMVDAGGVLKNSARAMIGRAGFSKKWQNAYRVKVYPEGSKVSIDAAAFGRSAIDYADIFSTGGTLHGKPYLWVPFSTTPKVDRRKTNAEPKDFINKGIKLFVIKPPGKRMMLATDVLMTRSSANKLVPLTFNNIKQHKKAGKHTKVQNLIRKTVPLFFALDTLSVRRRFDWNVVVAETYSKVPALYDANIAKLAETK